MTLSRVTQMWTTHNLPSHSLSTPLPPFVPDRRINLDHPVILESRTRPCKPPNPKFFADIDIIEVADGLEDSTEVQMATKEELKQLVEIGAWHPVLRRDATKRPIPSKMLIKHKLDSKGNLVKVKARLCAGGAPPTYG
jgi:hypothetical protein